MSINNTAKYILEMLRHTNNSFFKEKTFVEKLNHTLY